MIISIFLWSITFYTAVVRAKDDILVKNALLWDIQRFYKEEYQIGKRLLELLKRKQVCFYQMMKQDLLRYILSMDN